MYGPFLDIIMQSFSKKFILGSTLTLKDTVHALKFYELVYCAQISHWLVLIIFFRCHLLTFKSHYHQHSNRNVLFSCAIHIHMGVQQNHPSGLEI